MALGQIARLIATQTRQYRCLGVVDLSAVSLCMRHSTSWATTTNSRAYSNDSSSYALPSHPGEQVLDQVQSQLQSQVLDVANLSSFAAQPLEPLWQFLNPVVLGSSVWETVHSASGLPWWASIPLTTLGLRTVLLPFTMKAKSAALNWVLLQTSLQTANRLLDQMQQKGSAPVVLQQQPAEQMQQLKKPGKLKLVRMYYRYFRKQQRTTSMWWWTCNAFVQVNVFIVMSAALRNMSAVQWPGFTTEGAFWFSDLTQPAAVWSTLQCPYGVAGIGLPFALLGLYKFTIDRSPAAIHPRLELLLEFGMLPVFVLSTMVPQATLLYWLGNSVFFLALQETLKQPKVARALGLPTAMLPLPKGPKEEMERAEQEAADAAQLLSQCGSEDDGFLRFLAASYLSRGKDQQAMQCLQRLTILAPGDGHAFSALGRTAAELQQWPAAAAAYERSAELCAAAGDQDEQTIELVLAGKHWLTAAAEARQLQRVKKGTGSKVDSSSSTFDGSVDDAAAAAVGGVRADKQQEYLESALRVLQAAVNLPSHNTTEGWYLLATARAAANQCSEAFTAAQTYWARACAAALEDPSVKRDAAVKILPVLTSAVGKCQVPADGELMLRTARLAAEVAESGWDRQSQEKLLEVLETHARKAGNDGMFTFAEQLRQLKVKVQRVDSGLAKVRNR